jgi:hypothetical protein
MVVLGPRRVLFTFLVIQEDPPERGQDYLDADGHHWMVRGVSREGPVLRDPPGVGWLVELEGEHQAYRIPPCGPAHPYGGLLRRFFRADEIALRRDRLRVLLGGLPSFLTAGTTDDGTTLIANFQEEPPEGTTPSLVDGMPVVVRLQPHG